MLYSPHTAIVDFTAVARCLAADVIAAGGAVELGRAVSLIVRCGEKVAVRAGDEQLVFDRLVVCARLQADRGVDIGPNAVLALAREGYLRRGFCAAAVWEMARYPGLRRLAARHWWMGACELLGSLSTQVFLSAARSFIPELGLPDAPRHRWQLRAHRREIPGVRRPKKPIDLSGAGCGRVGPTKAAPSQPKRS